LLITKISSAATAEFFFMLLKTLFGKSERNSPNKHIMSLRQLKSKKAYLPRIRIFSVSIIFKSFLVSFEHSAKDDDKSKVEFFIRIKFSLLLLCKLDIMFTPVKLSFW